MRVVVPAFIYPSDMPHTHEAQDWARIMAVTPKLGGVIVNVNSGPGPSNLDPNYVRVIKALKSAGVPTFAYVGTDYGKRNDAAANMDAWFSQWQLRDFFLDEASTDPDKLEYYAKLNVRTSGRIITNQGASPQTSRYLKCADIICNFESSFSNYMSRTFSDWEIANKDRMFHIVLSCPPSQLSAAINRARMYAGYVFITHENDDKPEQRAYKFLPSYWEQLVARVSQPAVPSWFSGIVARIIEGKA